MLLHMCWSEAFQIPNGTCKEILDFLFFKGGGSAMDREFLKAMLPDSNDS